MVVGMHVVRPSGKPAAQPSGILVAWGNAWLTGHVGLDEAADAIEQAAGPQVIGEITVRRGLADLRVAGMTALRLALPVPGDPLGLTGPPEFNVAALEAGAAVIAAMPDRAVGLVPAEDRRGSSYVGIRWTVLAAENGIPDVPLLPEADHQLGQAVREATDVLLTVDDVSCGVPGRRSDIAPDITRALSALRTGDEPSDALAPGYPQRAHRVAALAGRLAVVVDLATGLDGHNLTADQMARRADALRLLDRAVRRARVAAYNSAFDPVP
jgi:hypothetical protein